jgi:putative ATPase
VIRFASEDVGLAAPQGLQMAMAAQQACHFVGMPECNLALCQAVVYLATAPKSNALYKAYQMVQSDIRYTMNEPVPMVIRNAPTKLMKELEYGKGYKYAHNFEDAQVEQEHLPDSIKGHKYYFPTDRGFEAEIKKRREQKK